MSSLASSAAESTFLKQHKSLILGIKNKEKISMPYDPKSPEMKVSSVGELVLKMNDIRKVFSGDEGFVNKLSKEYEKDPLLAKRAVESKKFRETEKAKAQKEYESLIKGDLEIRKMQTLNIQKIKLGMEKKEIIEILGSNYIEDTTGTVLGFLLYTYGDLIDVNLDGFTQPYTGAEFRFDTTGKLAAIVGGSMQNTLVFGKIPEYVGGGKKQVSSSTLTKPTVVAEEIIGPVQQEIKVNVAKSELKSLTFENFLTNCRVVPAHPYFKIEDFAPNSSFEKIGLKKNDILFSINDVKTKDVQSSMGAFSTMSNKVENNLIIKRDEKFILLKLISKK